MTERPKRPPLQDVLRAKQEERRTAEHAAAAEQAAAERPAPVVAITSVSDKRRQAWLDSMLARAMERMGAAHEGIRNDELNRIAYTLGGIVHLGLDERAARDTLRSVALGVGLDAGGTDRTLDSGFGAGKADPMTVELAERKLLNGAIEPPADDPVLTAFWGERELLQHVYDYARARRVSPWAVLGVELVRVSCCTEPLLTLPPLVGGHASLNLFTALVGMSGAGKGGAERVAGEALTMPHTRRATLGSGEGIAHSYRKRKRDGTIEHLTDRMLFSVPEVDTLAAVGGRAGATLLPELRRAWSGEQLGFAYADESKRLPVEAHSYRLGLVLGVQPARAHTLLDDVDGGTPQRFVWLPAVDRHAPDAAPPAPLPRAWTPPRFEASRVTPFSGGLAAMGVCEQARVIVDEAALLRLRGNLDALDGHLLLTQLKVGAALAILDGRSDVDEDDWRLAGVVMGVSTRTRTAVTETLSAGSRDRNRAKAEGEAARSLIVDEKRGEWIDQTEQSVAQRIETVLRGSPEPMPRKPLRSSCRANHRHVFDDVIEAMVESGAVLTGTDEKGVTRYAWAIR